MASVDRDPMDEIVFAWSTGAGRGNPGLQAISWTMNNDRLRTWEARLLPKARMEDVPSAPPPESSLSYLTYDTEAVLVHRYRTPDGTTKKEICHALVGPAEALTPRIALGLHGWPTREEIASRTPRGGEWPWRPLSEVLAESRYHERARDLAAAAKALAADGSRGWLLEAMLGKSLRHLNRQVSVGLPPGLGDPVIAILAFLDIAELLLQTLPQPDWTFSTWEKGDTGSGLPYLIFLPANLLTTNPGGLREVVSGKLAPTDYYLDAARHLTEVYGNVGRQGLRDHLSSTGVLALPTAQERVDLVRNLAATWVAVAAGPGRSGATEQPAVPVEPPAPVEPPEPIPPVPAPKEPERLSLRQVDDLVRQLLIGTGQPPAWQLLADLAELAGQAQPEWRGYVRQQLLNLNPNVFTEVFHAPESSRPDWALDAAMAALTLPRPGTPAVREKSPAQAPTTPREVVAATPRGSAGVVPAPAPAGNDRRRNRWLAEWRRQLRQQPGPVFLLGTLLGTLVTGLTYMAAVLLILR